MTCEISSSAYAATMNGYSVASAISLDFSDPDSDFSCAISEERAAYCKAVAAHGVESEAAEDCLDALANKIENLIYNCPHCSALWREQNPDAEDYQFDDFIVDLSAEIAGELAEEFVKTSNN